MTARYQAVDPDGRARILARAAELDRLTLHERQASGQQWTTRRLLHDVVTEGAAVTPRPSKTPMQRRAMRRMLGGIRVSGEERWHSRRDPVLYTDAMTSMADARAALNMTRGVPLEAIDSLGYHRRPR